MVLVKRISGSEGDKLRVHAFTAMLNLLGLGDAGMTRNFIVSTHNFDVGEEAELDEIIAFYQALSPADKKEFYGKLEAASVLLEEGIITEAQYKTVFGMT